MALGRGALDPLAVLAALCGPGREVAALNLHPLQALLPPDDLAAAVERVVITAVAQARPPAQAPGARASRPGESHIEPGACCLHTERNVKTLCGKSK